MTSPSDGEETGPLDNCEYPAAVAATVLLLTNLRSQYVVGRALVQKYPNEEDWNDLLYSPRFLEMIDEFAQVMEDAKSEALSPSDTAVAQVLSHYPRALVAVKEFAELVNVPAEDVLSVLLQR